MQTRNPDKQELIDLTARISKAFGYKNEEAGVERDFPQLYSASNISHLWVCGEGGKVAAHAGFFPTTMKVESLPLPVAGIGGVFTDEAFQGQGLATKLVEKCVLEAQKGGAALAFLWSDKHDFYEKNKFYLAGRQWSFVLEPAVASKLRALGEKAGILASALHITDADLSESFLRQSFALQEQLPLGIARSLEEHSHYMRSGSGRVISAWAGKELAAYFVVGKGHDLQGYIHEWAGAEGALHHLAAQCLEDFEQRLHLLSPQFMLDEVPWIYALEEAGIPARAEFLALVRLLSLEKVRTLLGDYLARLRIGRENFQIQQSGESFSVAWKGANMGNFSEKELLQFLFGPELPEREELRAFLPLRLWYWGMDSV